MKKPGLNALIGRFRTYRYCQSPWNVSLSVNWRGTCRPLTFYHRYNLDSARNTRLKPLFCGCCRTYYRPSTVVIQPPWSFWVYQRPLTRSTMRSCYSGCRQLLALMTVLIGGFSPTCQAGISMYAAGLRDQPSFTSSAECLRVLCWDQFCSSCTPWSWSRSLNAMVCRRIFTPTTPTTARVRLLLWMHFHRRSRSALTPLRPGWNQIGCSLIRTIRDSVVRDKLAPASIPSTGMLIDGVHITPVKSVRDLGIYIDAIPLHTYLLHA